MIPLLVEVPKASILVLVGLNKKPINEKQILWLCGQEEAGEKRLFWGLWLFLVCKVFVFGDCF
jgi:hypothetical protein